jgi:hypothetical protein
MTALLKTPSNTAIELFAVCANALSKIPIQIFFISLLIEEGQQNQSHITFRIYCFMKKHRPNYLPYTDYTQNTAFQIILWHSTNSRMIFFIPISVILAVNKRTMPHLNKMLVLAQQVHRILIPKTYNTEFLLHKTQGKSLYMNV